MRKDFKKLLCECYRIEDELKTCYEKGKKKKYQKHAKGDYDEWSHPKREPMSMGRGGKIFGENLKPLVRFLRSSVGRKWDNVFSEIRAVCKPKSAIGEHIYQHLWDYVELNPIYINGEVHSNPESWFGTPRQLADFGRDDTFYVDKNGILRRAPRFDSYRQKLKKRRKKEQEKAGVFVLDGVYYVCKDGIWFETKLVPLPKPYKKIEILNHGHHGKIEMEKWYYPYFEDKFLGVGEIDHKGPLPEDRVNICIRRYGKAVYCSQLRQLNSREIKKFGLKK